MSQLLADTSLTSMDAKLVDTLTLGDYTAEVYSTEMPGEFKVVYRDRAGNQLEEVPLTGISSYKQREPEIRARLRQFEKGAKPASTPDRGDSGEY